MRVYLIKSIIFCGLILTFFGCKNLLFQIGLSEKGPEELKFREKLQWYEQFVHGIKQIDHVYLPDSIGINDDGLRCYEKHELIRHLDKKQTSKFNAFINEIERKNNLGDAFFQSQDLQPHNEESFVSPPSELEPILNKENTVYLFFTISEENVTNLIINDKYDQLKKLAEEKEDVINFIPNTFEELVFSENYRVNDTLTLPVEFKKFCNSIFQDILNGLDGYDEVNFNLVKKAQLSFNKEDNSPLWASSSYNPPTVYLSPHLIRAVFIMTFNNYNGEGNSKNIVKMIKDKRLYNFSLFGSNLYMNEADFRIHNLLFEDYFKNRISFVIRHELAHIYLDTRDEKLCDCYALATYSRQGIWSKNVLGIYEEMLKVSIENKREDLWGLRQGDLNTLIGRFNYLDSISIKKVDFEICNMNK